MEPELVAGRQCGTCNVCCVELTIDDPELRKLQGYRCKNLRSDKTCGIYEARPQTCRTFYCGWRRLKWVRDPLRPDVSGVLVQLHGSVSTEKGARLGVAFSLLNNAALKADGLAESVAAAVAADIPVYLHQSGPPGYTYATVRMNEILGDAVHFKDKAAILDILRTLRAKARSGERQPVVLAPRAADQAANPAT